MIATVMFEDGSGVSYRNVSTDVSRLVLVAQDGRGVGRLEASFPEPDTLVLEGPLDGQDVRMTLRRIAVPKKEYRLTTRGFHWVQELPFSTLAADWLDCPVCGGYETRWAVTDTAAPAAGKRRASP